VKKLLLIAIVVLLSSVGTIWASPLDDALVAEERGDYATALSIFRSLAAQGDANAQSMLGSMYEKGHGVAQDYAEALKWYRLAAAQGNTAAQLFISAAYLNGHGVKRDIVHAYLWSILSGVSGNAGAVKDRDWFEARMTPQQIAEAQKMARECQERKFKGCD
jgi:TPR repeat protein